MAYLSFHSSLLKSSLGLLCVAFALTASPEAEAKKPKKSVAQKRTSKQDNSPDVRSSVVINAETGEILNGECNPKPNGCHDRRVPASLTKLMTGMVAFDGVRGGKISLDDTYNLVDAESLGRDGAVTLKKKGIRPGSRLTGDSLLNATAVTSAADATMTLSKALCGTTDCIVDLMNAKLKVIFKNNPHGLHTNFANAHGMPDADQYTTAYDQAVIAAYMAKNYKGLGDKYFAETSYAIGRQRFNGHNKLLVSFTCKNALSLSYKCMELSKTGYFSTPEPGGLPAKWCVAGTAVWNRYRVSAAVLGYPGSAGRFAEEERLLRQGFTTLAESKAPRTVDMPLHFPSIGPDPVVEPEPDTTEKTGKIPGPQVIPPTFFVEAAPR